MYDELGLDLPVVPIKDRVKEAVRKSGRLFFSIRESAALLGVTGFRVYNLVYHYRLDAFLIGGEYRIPWTAVLCLEEELPGIRRQFFTYLGYVGKREVRGFFRLRRAMAGGCSAAEARDILGRGDLGDDMIRSMSERRLPPRHGLETREKDPQDWYDIPSIGLPDGALPEQWAGIIGCRPSSLGFAPGMVPYTVMYDFLVEHEVVNLPVPYRVTEERPGQAVADQQLLLF